MKKRIVILGGGESGTGTALLAKEKGFEVFVSDQNKMMDRYRQMLEEKDIPYEEGGHTGRLILNADEVIKSPGIPYTAPLVQQLLAKGVSVIDELEFALRYTQAKIIAITGTNGKTTTTMLTYHLLKEAGLNVGIAGNIGQSMAGQVIDDEVDYYVLEVSSFQLDGIKEFKPDISILLNITPDHLDRYGEMGDYMESKFGIVRNADKHCDFIYFSDDALLREGVINRDISAKLYDISLSNTSKRGGHYKEGSLVFNLLNHRFEIPQSETSLRGPHNAVNMMAAGIAAFLSGVDMKAIAKGLATYRNAPHRMEYVAKVKQVDFVNDSKATNVDAVAQALDSFENPLVWIAGGVDKGNDYRQIMDKVNRKVRALVCLGVDNRKLRDAFHDHIVDLLEVTTMKDAVVSAMEYAQEEDTVLLSPACASFDLFDNYEDRGNQFRKEVGNLKNRIEYNDNNQ